jgi:hypothetical protein
MVQADDASMNSDRCLLEWSSEYASQGTPNCWLLAWRLAERLVAEAGSPSIFRIREWSVTPAGPCIEPLTPTTYRAGRKPTWNTHYVCVWDGVVYEPYLGEKVKLSEYSSRMFGREIAMEECVDAATVLDSIRKGLAVSAAGPDDPRIPRVRPGEDC